jgi:hypothetical protein
MHGLNDLLQRLVTLLDMVYRVLLIRLLQLTKERIDGRRRLGREQDRMLLDLLQQCGATISLDHRLNAGAQFIGKLLECLLQWRWLQKRRIGRVNRLGARLFQDGLMPKQNSLLRFLIFSRLRQQRIQRRQSVIA